jgi:hypothetical protein
MFTISLLGVALFLSLAVLLRAWATWRRRSQRTMQIAARNAALLAQIDEMDAEFTLAEQEADSTIRDLQTIDILLRDQFPNPAISPPRKPSKPQKSLLENETQQQQAQNQTPTPESQVPTPNQPPPCPAPVASPEESPSKSPPANRRNSRRRTTAELLAELAAKCAALPPLPEYNPSSTVCSNQTTNSTSASAPPLTPRRFTDQTSTRTVPKKPRMLLSACLSKFHYAALSIKAVLKPVWRLPVVIFSYFARQKPKPPPGALQHPGSLERAA